MMKMMIQEGLRQEIDLSCWMKSDLPPSKDSASQYPLPKRIVVERLPQMDRYYAIVF